LPLKEEDGVQEGAENPKVHDHTMDEPKFLLFSKLPVELRLKIWKDALAGSKSR